MDCVAAGIYRRAYDMTSTSPNSKKAKKRCKYCEPGPVIVMNYDKKEAKLYAEHLRHKHHV